MLWFEMALLPDGWSERVRIEVAEGRISRVETGAEPRSGDERFGIAIPGLANVHSHGFQRGMAGLAESRGPTGDNFWTWREVMYRFLDRLSPDDVEAITALAYVEMLESGFTRVGEFHYLHHDPAGRPYADIGELAVRIAAAARETGIGLTLLPVFYAHANFGGVAPLAGQRRFITEPASFARIHERCRHAVDSLIDANVGIAPHSLRAVTADELGKILPLAPKEPIHIHAAEQTKEVDDCLAWSGTRPVAWLLDHVPLDQRWCIVHATHVDSLEVERLAGSGAVAGLCPVTEANLGDGIFPATEYLGAEGRLGIGTDSNILVDAPAELRGLEYAQRLLRRERNVLAPREGCSTGRALFDRALSGGMQALGVHEHGLRNGASADILAFDVDDVAFAGRGDDIILDRWIFARANIRHVWRAGRLVVRDGHHVAAGPIRERYRKSMIGLLE